MVRVICATASRGCGTSMSVENRKSQIDIVGVLLSARPGSVNAPEIGLGPRPFSA
jgi:hypothetical protein